MAMNRIACELVRTGGLGKILEVQAPATRAPGSRRTSPGRTGPAGLDWDMWLNQAAWRPFNGRWGGGGRDFAGGEMTNWGAHGVDQIQWGLGMDGTGPVEMWPPPRPERPGRNAVRQRRAGPVRPRPRSRGGAVFVCEKGKLEINRNKFTSNPRTSPWNCSRKSTPWKRNGSGATRPPCGRPNGTCRTGSTASARGSTVADVEIGHRSITVCHLANITRWVGRR